MITIQRLVLLLTLGLALALAGCGGDDDDGDGNGGNGGETCEGENATLAGSCSSADGSCYEARGDYGNFDPAADCADEGGTWSTSACPASVKGSGACVVNVMGMVAVSWVPDTSPADWQMACESSGLGCYVAP